MPSSSRELQVYPCIPRLTECFGAGSSGGNFLVPARKLIRSRLKGRCRKAAPLSIPRPHRRKCTRMFQVAMGRFYDMPPNSGRYNPIIMAEMCRVFRHIFFFYSLLSSASPARKISPAPMVSTTSPSRTFWRRYSVTSGRVSQKTAPGIFSATSAEEMPMVFRSRAA